MNRRSMPRPLERLRRARSTTGSATRSPRFLHDAARAQASSSSRIGGIPVKRIYTAPTSPTRRSRTSACPAAIRSRAGPIRRCTAGGSGRCGRSPASAPAEDTNKRFKYLIAQGQTGLSTDFDMPTLMGYDSDHPMSEGEVGREGVAIDTLADMEALFDGIDLEKHLGVDDDQSERLDPARDVRRARRRSAGSTSNKLSGTIQADILKEYHGAEGMDLPDRAVGAHRARLHHLLRAEHEALQPDQHLRLSHLGGRQLAAATRSAFTMCNLHRLRRGGDEDRHARRRVRAAARVLLRLPRPISSRRSPSSARRAAATRRS